MAKKVIVYTGTYQDQYWMSDQYRPKFNPLIKAAHGIGIGRFEFDPESGRLSPLGYTYANNNPATLWVSPNQKYLYAAHETKNFDGALGAGGGLSAYKIDQKTGDLILINTVSSCGTFAAYVTTDRLGEYVVVGNHASYFYTTTFTKTGDGDYVPQVHHDIGSLALFRVRPDGGVEEACDVQELPGCGYDVHNQNGAHPHSVEITLDDFVITPNKGGDRVDVFKLDRKNGKLLPIESFPANPGAAPRHIAIHPSLPFFFIINEFNNKVVAYQWDRTTGKLTEIMQSFTVPSQFVGKSYTSCDVKIHPSGKFLYVTNHPPFFSITAFNINQKTGELNLIGSFREVMDNFREIAFDPSGKYLVGGSMDGDRMLVFEVDEKTGLLSKSKHEPVPAVYPSCTHFAEIG
ncbi:hypothetical protein FACS1894130_06300 [Spirochaetia bacterium]|nr:hypothetical protein FACS1894130_06300 [Spirochaetia bacterium]